MSTARFFISPKDVYIEKPDHFSPAVEPLYHDRNNWEWLEKFISNNLELFKVAERDFYDNNGYINERILLELMASLHNERKFIEFAAWSACFSQRLTCDLQKIARYLKVDIQDIIRNSQRYCLGGLMHFDATNQTFTFSDEHIRDYYAARYVMHCINQAGYIQKNFDLQFEVEHDWDDGACTLRHFISELLTYNNYAGLRGQLTVFNYPIVAGLKKLHETLTTQGDQFDISKISNHELQIVLEASKNSTLSEKQIIRKLVQVEYDFKKANWFKDKLSFQYDEISCCLLKISGDPININTAYNMISGWLQSCGVKCNLTVQ